MSCFITRPISGQGTKHTPMSASRYARVRCVVPRVHRFLFGHAHTSLILVADMIFVRVYRRSARFYPQTFGVFVLQAVLGVDLGGETEGEILQAVRRPSVGGRLPLHVVHSVIALTQLTRWLGFALANVSCIWSSMFSSYSSNSDLIPWQCMRATLT